MKQALNLKLTQGPVMTPQLRQAIEMLAMPMQEVTAFVENELLENPFLQKDDGVTEYDGEQVEVSDLQAGVEDGNNDVATALESNEMATEMPLDYAWDNVYDGGLTGSGGNNNFDSTTESVWEKTATEEKTLADFLTEQLHMTLSDYGDIFIGEYLIDAITDAGYLSLDMADTARRLRVSVERLEDILSVIQTFEPVGVGARDLYQCLRLQMHAQDNLTDTAEIVLNNLDLLAKRDFKKLAKLAGGDVQGVLDSAQDITKCNPKPGLEYGSGNSQAIIPDAVVFERKGKLEVELNAEALPKVLLNRTAQDLFVGENKEAKDYISERLGRGQWLIKSLEQRARNILKISKIIVAEQADFFTYGVESLKPLTLKQVAEKAGVHESTVSRVTTGKYMQTPLGMFELKHFFSAGIGTTGGNVEVAAISVKAMIKRLIEAEDRTKPISDEKLVTALKNEGINIARRTVAKYREAMNIPSSSGRRLK